MTHLPSHNGDPRDIRYREHEIETGRIVLKVREGTPELVKAVETYHVYQLAEEFLKFFDEDKEQFCMFCLDAKNHVTHVKLVSTGILTASLVHPREVFRFAIMSGAAGIILFHNHPSGDPEPSPEDHEVTHRIAGVGQLVGIDLLDHLVIANGRYVSFLERGIISR